MTPRFPHGHLRWQDQLLQQILAAAKSQDKDAVLAKAKKGLGEDVDDVDETGFLEEMEVPSKP